MIQHLLSSYLSNHCPGTSEFVKPYLYARRCIICSPGIEKQGTAKVVDRKAPLKVFVFICGV